MRKLVLHVGAHKTGTTALQQNLHQNRILLGACGVSYASAASAAHLHAYLGPLAPGRLLPDGFAVLDPEGLAQSLSAADYDLVIASSENFSFFFHKDPIVALEKLLRPLFSDITVLCYLRRQDRHAISHHQEGAKPHRQAEGDLWGHAPSALPDYSPAHDLYLDYDRRLGLWADVFGADKLTLRVYDRKLLKNGDIFADFLAAIGLNILGMPSIGDRNVSLSATQTKAGHLMNAAHLRPRITEAILQHLPTDGRLLPSQDQALAFLDRYRASNRRLNARFNVTALPDLFDDNVSDYPTTPQSDWTDAGATATLRAVMQELNEVSPTLQALTADDLRVAAQALAKSNPDAARRLIHAAAAIRPQGPAILRLKAELDHGHPPT